MTGPKEEKKEKEKEKREENEKKENCRGRDGTASRALEDVRGELKRQSSDMTNQKQSKEDGTTIVQ